MGFATNFVASFAISFARNLRGFTTNFATNFVASFAISFARNLRGFTTNFATNFIANFAISFARNLRGFTTNFATNFVANFARNLRGFTTNFATNFVASFVTSFAISFARGFVIRGLFLFLIVLVVSACGITFTTREDKMTSSKSSIPLISEVRKQNAEMTSRLMNYEEDLRIKDGRIEELEVYIKQFERQNKSELKGIIEERDAYRDSLSALNKEKLELLKELALVKEEHKETNEKLKWASTPADEMLKTGDKFFEDKKWTEAVTTYQLFREKTSNKKTSEYAMVTYKIGVCFQELGLKNEAKTFYKSVVNGFSTKFKAHKFASYRLSQISR